MFWVFVLLAALAFEGFFSGMLTRNGHRMAYAAVMVVVWIVAALWWAGKLAL